MDASIPLGAAALYAGIGVGPLAHSTDPQDLDPDVGCSPGCAERLTQLREAPELVLDRLRPLLDSLFVLLWPLPVVGSLRLCRCLRVADRRARRRARAARKAAEESR